MITYLYDFFSWEGVGVIGGVAFRAWSTPGPYFAGLLHGFDWWRVDGDMIFLFRDDGNMK